MSTETENSMHTAGGGEQGSRLQKRLLAALGAAFILAAVLFLADARRPQFYMLAGKEIETALGEPFEDPGVYAVLTGRVFGEGKRRLTVRTDGAVDTSRPGSYELAYFTEYLGREYRCTRRVQVADKTAPVITLQNREGYYVNWLEGYEEEGFTAWDNADGDLTGLVTAVRRGEAIVYSVSDAAGNTATAERVPAYTVGPPELRLSGETDVRITAGFLPYEDPGCTASDRYGHDMTDRIRVQGEVIPWRAGTYELVYSITNRTGEMIYTIRRVTVDAVPTPDPVEPEGKTIYLTFDDGPGRYTDKLLDVLDKYGVKATFFVTCDQPDYFSCIARAHEAGHAIGVHSASHVYDEIYSSEEAFFADFRKVLDMIAEQTGETTAICRFPGGSDNTVSSFNPGVMTRLASDVRDLGYQYFDWNVYSGDAGGKGATTESDTVFQNVTEGIADKKVAVVLQHDIKSYSVDAVESIILWGLENGYTFLPLDPASPPVHEIIAN